MSVDVDWPAFGPRLDLTFDIASGVLTLGGTSKLLNPSDYVWGAEDQVVATVYKNGTKAVDIAIDSSTGALTMSQVSVTSGDHIEARFTSTGYAATPWKTTIVQRRSAFFDVPAGTSQFVFDATHTPMPVPAWDLAFGWDAGNKLKLGFKVAGDDGATEDMTVSTRKLPSGYDTSTAIDLDDTTNTQTHTSSFTKADIPGSCELETVLASGTGATRMEDRFRLVLTDKTAVGSYPSGFPGSGTMLVESVNSGRWKLARP